ncbi:E3 ubiquitin-protein ligase UPL6-like isoform X8 [Malus sylvestris]|uniref:E3 ubiquitin-protein ligase UPL6-like isoform X8 n=1 Tax=Malus sylvestris TaxID=3752 RepID=UPI0021ABCBA7|nr:E3 ubiquitin-protein ligase UPL6-like isoform X8 [Malus sylvestris]
MFFSGDSSTRKRVDLGGRSTKERDRQKLLEQTRLERNRRLWIRQQNLAALKIQKCFRGRKVAAAEHSKVREQFYGRYGRHCQNADRFSFGPDSEFLRQLLFFFDARSVGDFSILVETCRLLHQFVKETGDIISLVAGMDYSSKHALVKHRVKQLAYICMKAVHQNRNQLKDQLFAAPEETTTSTTLLLEALVLLIDPKLPWACETVGYLLQRKAFILYREIILTGKESIKTHNYIGRVSSLERSLAVVISHIGQEPCTCPNIDPHWSFSSQILTVPFVWKLFPYLGEVFARRGLSQHYINQMSLCVKNHADVLPKDASVELPGYACLIGNILESSGVALSQTDCSFQMALDLAGVATFLLEALPSMKSSNRESKEDSMGGDDMIEGDDAMEICLNNDLERQICDAIDLRFLLQLTNVLFGGISLSSGLDHRPDDKEVSAVGAACAFLHVTLNTLPLERIMTILAYRTELVPVLWNFMKRCHENQKWQSVSEQLAYLLPGDAPGWLLPLAVFCPVYKHMLTVVDNEEFYEQEKPLSLKDIRYLVIILRQALWQLLWVNPTAPSNSSKPVTTSSSKKHPVELIQHRVSIVASELLSQLQDWNNRREFTSPSDFHADGVNEFFITQAVIENTRANDIMKQAPFLVPFTSRVKIFTSQLAAARQRHESNSVFTRNRFRIRRDRILEDAYDQMSALSEDDLRGPIRVTFVNEFGVEEAGIDGGGIFKDFMENITQAAFDVQYGLFKETSDHLLYPSPGSGMIHEQHLQFFHFLGILLAKAMFEGILVDIPFATFFLSKLKQKYNYLNDLPSLDPELYRHLIFLKLLISGSLDSLDVDDLRMHANSVGGYHSEHFVIDMFWDVLKSFSLENQKKFLKFVTGCSRGPLLGFKYLEPLFCIQRAGNGAEGALDRLPTAATCMNLLKLPPYRRSTWNQN